MNTRDLLVMLIVLMLSACAPSAPANPADRFAGTWIGNMSFSDSSNRQETIIVSIPTGCTAGNVCGNISNTTVDCQWEVTLTALHGAFFEYTLLKTLSGECAALGGGRFTLGSHGALKYEYKTPDLTMSGILTRK